MDKPEQKDRRRGRFASKIQKGFTAAYPTQSSIPYKLQTSVIPESEKKGFNSQARRFYHKKDDAPGPGFYNITHQSPVSNSVSLSKKGTCTFPSMSARLGPITSKYPAANAYTIPSEFISKKDFSTSCSSMFQLPSFVKALKFETPAPNHYNKNNVSARAGFMSKTPRGIFTAPETAPPPGHYNVNESLVKQSPKILMSCFKSKTDRGLKLTSTGPGPGYYNPDDHSKAPKKALFPKFQIGEKLDDSSAVFRRLPLYSPPSRTGPSHLILPQPGSGSPAPRKNPTLTFSAPPLPLPPKPPLPGPGQYEIVDYAGPPKYFISSASFVSNTSRWTAAPAQEGLPGPATYRPEVPGKQSFLYNEDNKWIPAL